jgi:hypothetical protein
MKMLWLKPIFNEVGMVFVVKCHVCTRIERKERKLVVRWDSINKHACEKKGCDSKWIMDPKCMHVKHEISYA